MKYRFFPMRTIITSQASPNGAAVSGRTYQNGKKSFDSCILKSPQGVAKNARKTQNFGRFSELFRRNRPLDGF